MSYDNFASFAAMFWTWGVGKKALFPSRDTSSWCLQTVNNSADDVSRMERNANNYRFNGSIPPPHGFQIAVNADMIRQPKLLIIYL